MKNFIKIYALIILLLFVFALSPIVMAKKSEAEDKYKPIKATDIKIVKKIKFSQPENNIQAQPSTPPGLDKVKPDDPSNGAAVGFLGEPLAEGAQKYAIVIGICNYPGEGYDICSSDGDAQNMNDALADYYGYAPNNIYLLRDLEATYASITGAIANVVSVAKDGDEIVFFYSGHGVSGFAKDGDKERKDEALLVHNGTGLEYIWDGQLRDWFSGIAATRVAFIFDTCLAGGMNDVVSDGRLVIMSSKENESSGVYSYGENGEGVFSHFFVNEAILRGLGKVYDYSGVSLEEAFDYAYQNISAQTPQVNDDYSGDLLLGHYGL